MTLYVRVWKSWGGWYDYPFYGPNALERARTFAEREKKYDRQRVEIGGNLAEPRY